MVRMSTISTVKPRSILPLIWALVLVSLFASTPSVADDSCVISISQPLVDYGRTTRAELLGNSFQSRQTLLGKRTLTLSAICDTKAERAVTFQAEAADDSRFRFGKRGNFSLRIVSAQMDGRSVKMVSSGALGGSASGSVALLRPGVGIIPFDGPKAAVGERLIINMEVETYIDAEATRARSEEIWEGGGSFDIERIN